MRHFFTFILLFSCINTFAQNIQKIIERAELIVESEPEKAIHLLKEAKKKNPSTSNLSQINLTHAVALRIQGNYEESIQLTNSVLKQKISSNQRAAGLNNLGSCYKRIGKRESAMKSYLESLKLYESQKEHNRAAILENNIGLLYQDLGNFEKAKSYHEKALAQFSETEDTQGITKSYNYLGIVYANIGDFTNALRYFQKSYLKAQKSKNKVELSEAVNNIGGVYFYLGNKDSALHYFHISLEIDRANKDASNLADGMNNIAEVYFNFNQFPETKLYLDSAIQVANRTNYATAYLRSLEIYGFYYEALNEPTKSLEYTRKYYQAKDSISALNNTKNLHELETKYQTEKKERQLLKNEIELRRKNNIILVSVISFIAFVLIAWLIFRALRLKNKHQKQAFELKEQIATVETENRLQGQRLAISRDLHDNIGSQLTFIISSIDNLKYAYQIPDERINQKMDSIADFTRSTITELRDTIWAMNHSNIRFDDIQVRIATYLEKAKSTQENIQFSFNVQDGIPDRTFSSMEGMNCYRIIQEAINNSLKYANASAIDVNISQENSHLVIQISDNGKGFDEKEIEFGNGLRNMQNRAIEMGGTCEIKSEKDKGTVVCLRLPISLEKV